MKTETKKSKIFKNTIIGTTKFVFGYFLIFGVVTRIDAQIIISGALEITSGAPGAGKVLTSNATGVATWQTPGGGGGGSAWSLLGDAGTVDGTNFLGTTDNVPLTFSVNGSKAGRIDHIRKNSLFGYECGNNMSATTGGQNNSAFGYQSMQFGGTADFNVSIGYQTMQFCGSPLENIAIGNYAMQNAAPGPIGNVAIGQRSNIAASGNYNVGVGYESLMMVSVGTENVGVGYRASMNDQGSWNTSIGSRSLLSLNNGVGVSGLGAYTNVSGAGINCTALGYQAVVNSSNKVRLGNTLVTVIEGTPPSYTSSDGRFKSNVNDKEVKGLEFVKLLRPVVYNLETRKFQEFLTKNMPDSIRQGYLKEDFSPSTSIRRSGFIAQEVEEAAKKANFNFDGVHVPVDENDNYSLAYGSFVVPLVKAVQEQQAMIEELKQELKELKSVNNGTPQNKTTDLTQLGTVENGVAMEQNIPNPFTHETVVKYNLPKSVNSAYMAVYDLTGKQITSFVLTEMGTSSITITSEKLAAGIYIYSIVADGKIMDSKRMIVLEK